MNDHFVCADCDTVCAVEFRYEGSPLCIDCASTEHFSIGGN